MAIMTTKKTERTEFYEVAVRAGFYGADTSGLTGKKDNVRKFWEDMSIKLHLRPILETLLRSGRKLRVVDLGCGAGEGFELLTHVPPWPQESQPDREFLLSPSDIETYVGLDISPGMVAQGRENYAAAENVRFEEANLAYGFPLATETPFDLYFSSYGSLSHLTFPELVRLIEEICRHIKREGYIVFDLMGRFSPEWPQYWGESGPTMLPYNMAYLLPAAARTPEKIESFRCCFWSAAELRETLKVIGERKRREIEICALADRSIFVGRHMDTGLFNGHPRPWRDQVNRLLDQGYRGQIEQLRIDLGFLAEWRNTNPPVWKRLNDYADRWNTVIDLLGALMARRDEIVRRLIESADPALAEDLKMLAWLCRNGTRFPVDDYWASVVGPQTALVLRNLETSLPDVLGCGHALFCVARVACR